MTRNAVRLSKLCVTGKKWSRGSNIWLKVFARATGPLESLSALSSRLEAKGVLGARRESLTT